MPSTGWRRYAAPAAFLAAVTVAAILVHAGLHSTSPRPSHAATTTHERAPTTTGATRRYWTVRAGDTFASISSSTGVPVARIQRLNPAVKSTSLFIGEKIRLR